MTTTLTHASFCARPGLADCGDLGCIGGIHRTAGIATRLVMGSGATPDVKVDATTVRILSPLDALRVARDLVTAARTAITGETLPNLSAEIEGLDELDHFEVLDAVQGVLRVAEAKIRPGKRRTPRGDAGEVEAAPVVVLLAGVLAFVGALTLLAGGGRGVLAVMAACPLLLILAVAAPSCAGRRKGTRIVRPLRRLGARLKGVAPVTTPTPELETTR